MQIPISKIKLSDDNPRTIYDDLEIQALADSIKTYGLIHPISVKQLEDGYELIAGERRLRAVKKNGFKEISATILNLPDKLLSHIRIIENIQRRDLHPYEEAKHIEKLITNGSLIEDLSGELGKSKRYVYDRLSLLNLCSTALDYFLSGVLNIGHALNLSRLTIDTQEELLRKFTQNDGERDYITVNSRQLKAYIINNITTKLTSANFDKTDPTLNPDNKIACTNCLLRSGYNTNLFHDITDGDICFSTKCFNTKLRKHCERLESEYLGLGFEVVRLTNVMFPGEDLKHDYHFNKTDKGVKDLLSTAKSKGTGRGLSIGIYFNGSSQNLIGQVVQIITEEDKSTPAVQRRDTKEDEEISPDRDGLYGIRLGKAKEAFTNSILKDMAAVIGERPTELLVPNTLRYIGTIIYDNLPEELKDNIRAYYKFNKEDQGSPSEFSNNSKVYSYAKLCEIVLFILTYGGLKGNKDNEVYKELLYDMARSYGVDINELKANIVKQFNVEL